MQGLLKYLRPNFSGDAISDCAKNLKPKRFEKTQTNIST